MVVCFFAALPELCGGLFWVVLVLVVSFAAVAPAEISFGALCRRVEVGMYGIVYLLISRDQRFQLPPDPGKSRAVTPLRKKRIIFVRHGESVWNEVFNRGFGLSFPMRLLSAIARETALLFTLDSLFWDSPLGDEGVAQARCLSEFLRSSATSAEELKKSCEGAVFVTSCLRRAAATAVLGFGHFFGDGRPLWVLSCLQEISRNVDTLALAGPQQVPPLPASFGPTNCLHGAYNRGNKGLCSVGASRLEMFCDWVFSEASPAALQPTVVVVGHSLWFRTFFQAYMPHTSYHVCKRAKITNCGVVVFDLELLRDPDGGHDEYRVVPESVTAVHGGFEAAKPKKSDSTRMKQA
eukprot:TRINITY_DN27360_c0_g1_i1.p1 TRINITY_DN27360_c0_g1~~TRINITY_DN27360_c0_g1_i1.p1  ORF type:complete len:380 (+),score=55.15 TRINITY_DN27360_c0_g1_i1:90-1142(+)